MNFCIDNFVREQIIAIFVKTYCMDKIFDDTRDEDFEDWLGVAQGISQEKENNKVAEESRHDPGVSSEGAEAPPNVSPPPGGEKKSRKSSRKVFRAVSSDLSVLDRDGVRRTEFLLHNSALFLVKFLSFRYGCTRSQLLEKIILDFFGNHREDLYSVLREYEKSE